MRADFNRSAWLVRYELVESPAWLRIDNATGVVRGRTGETGDVPVVIEAFDDAGERARQAYTLHAGLRWLVGGT